MSYYIRKILVAALLFFIAAACAHAQEFPVLHFTMEDGLPSNKVYSLFRDSKGYMWIATDKGVARYNGIKFELFTSFNGLPDNEIFFFQEDDFGRLWMAAYNGALCFYKDGVFHTAANTPFLKLPFKASFTRRITLERDSSVTIVFGGENKFINIRHNHVKVIDGTRTKFTGADTRILEREKIGENRYRITSPDEVLETDTMGLILASSKLPVPNLNSEHPQYWNAVFTQSQNYIVSEHYIFDRSGQVLRTLDDTFHKENILYTVYHNSLGFFFATNNGIILNGNRRMLPGLQVSCITQDKPGNYWAATLENGLFVFDKYFLNMGLYNDVYKGKIQYCAGVHDHIYFSARDNNLYDLAVDNVSVLLNYGRYISEESKRSASRCMLIDNSSRFFCLNNTTGIRIEDLGVPYNIKKYHYDLSAAGTFIALFEVNNELYVNTDKGIIKTDLARLAAGGPLKYDLIADGSGQEKIAGFTKAPDNTIWYSTQNNVYKVINGKGVVQPQLSNLPFKYFAFFGNYLVGYTEEGKLFICSNYNGKPQTDSVSDQNCIWDKFHMLDDDHVLISTNNYYRLLTLSTRKIYLVENQFIPLQPDAICSDAVHLYFFKNGSIISMEKSRFLSPPELPKLFFTSLRTSSGSYPIHREVQIPFKEAKGISISFSTLSFSGKNISYSYSVSKDEDNWLPLNGEEISLANSGSGYYTIKVKAKTISGVYSAPIVFTLYISRPFWSSWWFITLCVWLSVALIAWLLRYRLQVILRKKERIYQSEIKFMKSEYKAMNALMNPHFIFNTLNNVQSLVNANDKVAANEYLRIFADLIRQNMHNISKELISLQKEVDLVGNYLSLEQLRFEDKLTYEINIEDNPNLDLSEIMVPPLLIQPLVENSIKHGILPLKDRKGIIKLEIYEKDDALFIQVKDNGIGMGQKVKKDSTAHESYGLENIRKRIDQLGIMQNKKITFQITEESGKQGAYTWTVVTIVIPFS